MPQILDAQGQPWQGALDQVGGGTITDARTATATLGALNAEVVMDLYGKAVAQFNMRTAAGNLTLTFEGSTDGTNYDVTPMPALNVVSEAQLAAIVITTTQASTYNVGCTGLRKIRCRVSTYSSGTVTVAARASVADYLIYAKPLPTLLWVTATATNATATATLPAGGAGLFHYISYIHCGRANNSAAAIAGTASLNITTTNLTGSPIWVTGNALAVGAQVTDLDLQPANPIKSTAANVASTIVMAAAGAAVVERINVGYYLGA